METDSRLIVVNSCVLPEVITKVIEVKKLLAGNEEKNSSSACKRVGISRSAYYKYKDFVFSYEDKLTHKIITLYTVLKDEPGVLSSVLSALHSLNTNILTLNQSIPVDGVAAVTLSLRLNGSDDKITDIRSIISEIDGVVNVKILSGE